MKKAVLPLTLIGFVACLLLGMYAGSRSFTPPSLNSPSPTAALSSASQHALVFVLVDSLQNRDPQLQSIWSATYDTQMPYVFMLVHFPTLDDDGQVNAEKLAKSFSVSEKDGLSSGFIRQLESGGFIADGIVVFDQQGLARAIDWLGGVDMGGDAGVLDGNAAASHSAWLEDPLAAIQWQRRMMAGMCQKFGHLPSATDWDSLSEIIGSDHYLTTIDVKPVEEEWINLVAKTGQIQCEVGSLGD